MDTYCNDLADRNNLDLYTANRKECHVCGSDQHGGGVCHGTSSDAPSKLDSITDEDMKNFADEENKKEAMQRFFAGEEPGFSTGICETLTAGYGKLDGSGYWEYQLPYPSEQWLKKKDFELKVKLNGMKYKARIIPFDSNEIIKRNFVHWCYDYHFGQTKRSEEDLKNSYDFYVNRLKETRDASGFLLTASVGESVQEHKGRIYLEIVDPTYPAAGRTPEEHMGC